MRFSLLLLLTGCLGSEQGLLPIDADCITSDAGEREIAVCRAERTWAEAEAECAALGMVLLREATSRDEALTLADTIGAETGAERWWVGWSTSWECPMMGTLGGAVPGDCEEPLPFACELLAE
jgi:hypothetical protein